MIDIKVGVTNVLYGNWRLHATFLIIKKKYIEILDMRYVFILIVFGSRKTKEELTQIG